VAGTKPDRLSDLYGGEHPTAEVRSPGEVDDDPLAPNSPFRRGAKLCLDRALKKNPGLRAKIEVRISAGADGKVSAVDIPMPYRADFIGQCLTGVIRHLPWKPSSAYEIPLVLLPQGG
jgi:hypothetical protein